MWRAPLLECCRDFQWSYQIQMIQCRYFDHGLWVEQTGQFYYIHWSSCKRAKQDPRELVRQADETVAAYLLEAHIRGSESESSSSEAECSSLPPDVCERTSSFCSVAADRELGNERVGCSFKEAENVEEKGQTVMVVSGCHGCSTFVLLSLSSPTCPSCGHSDVRGGVH